MASPTIGTASTLRPTLTPSTFRPRRITSARPRRSCSPYTFYHPPATAPLRPPASSAAFAVGAHQAIDLAGRNRHRIPLPTGSPSTASRSKARCATDTLTLDRLDLDVAGGTAFAAPRYRLHRPPRRLRLALKEANLGRLVSVFENSAAARRGAAHRPTASSPRSPPSSSLTLSADGAYDDPYRTAATAVPPSTARRSARSNSSRKLLKLFTFTSFVSRRHAPISRSTARSSTSPTSRSPGPTPPSPAAAPTSWTGTFSTSTPRSTRFRRATPSSRVWSAPCSRHFQRLRG